MDKTFELKLEDFKKAVKTLKEVLAEEKNDIVRDSTIQKIKNEYYDLIKKVLGLVS